MEPWLLPVLLLPLMILAFAGLWLWQRPRGVPAVVDVAWATGLAVCALAYASFVEGWGPRRGWVGALAATWYARLAWHLARRLRRENGVDGRYTRLREAHPRNWQAWLLGFYCAQAVFVVLPSLAFLAAMLQPARGFLWSDAAGLALGLLALAGQVSADSSLARWKANPVHSGRTCRQGLWKYSRHPNYFFEFVHWLAYVLLAWGSPFVWVPLCVAGVMLFLILKVTGIPPAEEQALRSRGADYRAYQRTTSAFLPLPPRRRRAVGEAWPDGGSSFQGGGR